MFKIFLEYVNETTILKIDNKEEFMSIFDGKTFLDGMYRTFKSSEIDKWNAIVGDSFPLYKGKFTVFGYDWLGRVFAINNINGTVLLFEPGTGEVLDIPATFEDFHNIELVEYHEDSLASRFFESWQKENVGCVLERTDCVGYKVPLFLNGNDTLDNLEVSNMEVYWEIMMPLINM